MTSADWGRAFRIFRAEQKEAREKLRCKKARAKRWKAGLEAGRSRSPFNLQNFAKTSDYVEEMQFALRQLEEERLN